MWMMSDNTSTDPEPVILMPDSTGRPRGARGTLTFDIRGDIIPCWLNINICQPLKNRKRDLVCDYWRWQSGPGPAGTRSSLCPTAIWKHFSSFSHAPSGLTKAAATTYTDFGTSFSMFYKAGPRMWPTSDTGEANLRTIPAVLNKLHK